MDQLPKDLNEGLMKELECPVCFEYMKPPISMCQNGHSICSNCKPKLDNCPSCRNSFLNVRNLGLESLSAVLLSADRTCKNSDCYKCPFAVISSEDCSWYGSIHDVKDHVKKSHCEGNERHETSGSFKVVLANLSSQRHCKKTVSIADEIFYMVWEVKGGNFFCVVLYVGPKENASKFKYTFSITADNGLKKISMIFQTHSAVENTEYIFTPGNCVLLHYDTVLMFLNSKNCLDCDFEISPVGTVSDVGRSHSTSGRSNAVKSDAGCFTVERGLAGKGTSQFESGVHHTFWKERGGRRGRGPAHGRFIREGRHRAAERSAESHGESDYRARDFQQRGNFLGRNSRIGRSMTDLQDGENYQAEMDTLHAILKDARQRFNPSPVTSPTKFSPTDRRTSIPGLDKSQDNVREPVSKSKLSTSLSHKKASNDKFTNVTARGKSQDGIQKSDLKVKSPSKENFVIDSALGKSLKYVQEDDSMVRPSSNLATVKCDPGKKPNNTLEFGESQDRVLKVSSPSSLATSKYASSDQVANASESSEARCKVPTIYPKLVSAEDDHKRDYSSPFDALYDLAKANDAKAKSSPDVSNEKNVRRYQSDDLFQDLLPTKSQTATSSPSSNGTWTCFLCGYPAPLKQPNRPLIDIAPAGTTRKCQLCGQWRR